MSEGEEVERSTRSRGSNIRGLMNAKKVYGAILYLKDKATIDKLMEYTELKRSTLYYTLKKLVEAGFVTRERVGRRVVYRIAQPLDVTRLVSEVKSIPDADVYRLARIIRKIMEAHGVEGDLIGSSKIHIEIYPRHQAIAPWIEAVVTKEHYIVLINMLIQYINAWPGFSESWRIATLYPQGIRGVSIIIYCDGYVEYDKVLWNLRKYLKREKRLTLEHAIVATLLRDHFTRNDRDDVYIGLACANSKKLFELMRDAVEKKPWLAARIRRNLTKFIREVEMEFPYDADMVKTMVKKMEKFIIDLESELKARYLKSGVEL